MSRDPRLAPSSLRQGLFPLVPLALPASALLGLLAQSVAAHDKGPVAPPTFTAEPTSKDDATPDRSSSLPANDPGTATATTDPAIGTVTIKHEYTPECAYGRTTAPTSFAACTTPASYTGSTTTDGQHHLAVRTVETTTSTFQAEGSTTTTDTSSGVAYSAAAAPSFVYDGNAPVLTIGPSPSGASRTPASP